MNRTDSDDLQQVVTDYPSVGGPIVRELRSLHRAISMQDADVKQTKAALENQRRQEVEEAHFAAIKKVHPDLDEISASDDFQGWLSRQTNMIKRAAAEGDAKDVIEVLDRYKAAVGIGGKQKKPKFTRAQIAAMTPEEFEEREKEIDQAVSRGEIV
jgi:hypothetical protein